MKYLKWFILFVFLIVTTCFAEDMIYRQPETPAGSNTEVQFNDGGSTGAEAAFTYDKTQDNLTVSTTTITTIVISGDKITDFTGTNLSVTAGILNASDGTPEGTAVKSTGEGGGTKYLREDGTGTCSWQTPAGAGDMVAAAWDGDSNNSIDVDAGGTNQTSYTAYSIWWSSSATTFNEIAIGTAGQYLKVNAGANGYEFAGVTASPAGNDTQLQYNNAGTTAGATGLTYNNTTGHTTAQDLDVTYGIGASTGVYSGNIEAGTLTEGGNAVYNATEVPGGSLGGTWASPTIDDLFLKNSEDDTTAYQIQVSSLVVTNAIKMNAVQWNIGDTIDGEQIGANTIDEDSIDWGIGAGQVGTADITEDTNKKFVTDAQLTVIGNTSGTNTGDNTVATSGDSATAFFSSGTLEEGLLPDNATVTGWDLGVSTATTAGVNDNDTSLATTAWCEQTQDYLKTGELAAAETDPLVDTSAEIMAIIGADGIKDTHLDFGTGVTQISLSDFTNDLVLTSSYTFVGSQSGVAVGVELTGDVTISTTGVTAVGNDSHEHTSATISGLDISDDTNLAGTANEITLTDDTLSLVILKDLVTTAPLSGGTDNILIGADSDITIAISSTSATSDGYLKGTDFVKFNDGAYNFTIVGSSNVYTVNGSSLCIVAKTPKAITITNIEVTCDSDPTVEPVMDLKYCDAFIGFANPAIINSATTTNGVLSDNSITSGDVAAGKCIYLNMHARPEDTMKSMSFTISWKYQ